MRARANLFAFVHARDCGFYLFSDRHFLFSPCFGGGFSPTVSLWKFRSVEFSLFEHQRDWPVDGGLSAQFCDSLAKAGLLERFAHHVFGDEFVGEHEIFFRAYRAGHRLNRGGLAADGATPLSARAVFVPIWLGPHLHHSICSFVEILFFIVGCPAHCIARSAGHPWQVPPSREKGLRMGVSAPYGFSLHRFLTFLLRELPLLYYL
jgi:hypothetical protein